MLAYERVNYDMNYMNYYDKRRLELFDNGNTIFIHVATYSSYSDFNTYIGTLEIDW